jgi:hypothetical protein
MCEAQFIFTAATTTTDRVCRDIATCAAGEFETTAPRQKAFRAASLPGVSLAATTRS